MMLLRVSIFLFSLFQKCGSGVGRIVPSTPDPGLSMKILRLPATLHGMKSTPPKNKQELKRKNTARERRQLAEWRKSHERIKNTAGQQQADDFSQLAQSFQQMVEDQTPTKKI